MACRYDWKPAVITCPLVKTFGNERGEWEGRGRGENGKVIFLFGQSFNLSILYNLISIDISTIYTIITFYILVNILYSDIYISFFSLFVCFQKNTFPNDVSKYISTHVSISLHLSCVLKYSIIAKQAGLGFTLMTSGLKGLRIVRSSNLRTRLRGT